MGNGCSSQRSGSRVQLNKGNIPNFKIALIGDAGVGKTNILLRYTKNQFDFSYQPTKKATIENVVKKLNVPTNRVVSVTLWDLPGHEDMDLRATYYKNVDAVVVVVDMSDESSIELASTWRQDFLNKASRTREVIETLPNGISTLRIEPVKSFNPRTVPMLLLGNKYDIVEEQLMAKLMRNMLEEGSENTLQSLSAQLGEDGQKGEEGDDECNESTDSQNKRAQQKNGKPYPPGDSVDDADLIEEDEDTDEKNNDEQDRLFTPLRGSQKSEESPKCVQLLDEAEGRHGFLGSIIVSAKDKDGSVDAALQSLVRHLLDKAHIIPQQPKKSLEKKTKFKKRRKTPRHDWKELRMSNVPAVDALFSRANAVAKRVFEHQTFYEVAVRKFRQGCADLGLLDDGKASLENCVVAVRDTVNNQMARELRLVEDCGFVALHFDVDDEEDKMLLKQQRKFINLMEEFHTELVAVAQAILKESPTMNVLLDKLDGRISEQAELLWEAVDEIPDQKASVERVCDICEKNRARIAHASLQVAHNVKAVETDRDKIRAAILW